MFTQPGPQAFADIGACSLQSSKLSTAHFTAACLDRESKQMILKTALYLKLVHDILKRARQPSVMSHK